MIISIIIPVYNVEQYIIECLQSILEQTYQNIECIIVDDKGNDRSIILAEEFVRGHEYRSSIKFHIAVREKNGGLSAARNTGLRIATGEYIYFLDSDDKLMPRAIEQLVKIAQKYPSVDMIQGNAVTEDGSHRWQLSDSMNMPEYSNDKEWISKSILRKRIPPCATNKLYRRDYLKSISLSFYEGILHEDELWSFLNQKALGSVAVTLENCYWIRTSNSASITHMTDKTKSVLSLLEIYKYISPLSFTREEKLYTYYIAGPITKVSMWNKIGDKDRVWNKIKEVLNHLKRTDRVPDIFIWNLRLWFLPCWMIDNIIFRKLLCEYTKHL